MQQPWHRQPNEDDSAWGAFQVYRDAGPGRRTSNVTVKNVRAPTEQVMTWYHANAWRQRVAAWDDHLDKIAIEERERATRETAADAAKRHRAMLRDMYELADRELQKYLEVSRTNDGPGLIKPAELLKLQENVIKLDRLLHDQPSEKTTLDLSGVSLDDLRDIEKKLRPGKE